jgi:erythromycin esterase-like protein
MMAQRDDNQLKEAIHMAAHPLDRREPDYAPLLDLVGDARFVLLGEASHGTHEFYHARAEITKLLIQEKGFTTVAVEADWPAAYRVNRYARDASDDQSAVESLGDFERFPIWMWRNSDVLDFVGWLRAHNDSLSRGNPKVGFYGIDLYSMHASMEAVLKYLDRVDPEAARRARYRYECFGHFGEDSQAYGYAASVGFSQPCEEEVINQLVELRRSASDYMQMDGRVAEDEYFYAEQNARLVKNAEQYYRSMFGGRMQSWNLRDQHMAETLDALVSHFDRQGQHTKVAVWAHNSHLGDARFTEMGQRGELNVGQLVRERYGRKAVLVGFSTNTGTVTAASNWDEPPQRKRVRPALAESYEALFHSVEVPDFLLILRDGGDVAESLRKPRLERAIGVIYRPETERISHYFQAQLPDQFDAVIHFDETRAVEPLERTAGWQSGEVPETYPHAV